MTSPRIAFQRRRPTERGETSFVTLLVIVLVAGAFVFGLSLYSTTAISSEASELGRSRAQANSEYGLLEARRLMIEAMKARILAIVDEANDPNSNFDLTTSFLEGIAIDDVVIAEMDVPGAANDSGVDRVSARTSIWLTAPARRPTGGPMSRFGGTGQDGTHTDEYVFAYETTAIGKGPYEAEVTLREEGTIPARLLINLSVGEAFTKGAADSGMPGGVGDFSSFLADRPPLVVDVPEQEPPRFTGFQVMGNPEVGQKIFVFTGKFFAAPTGLAPNPFMRIDARFDEKPLQTKMLYVDTWRRDPNYDALQDALRVVHEDGTVEFVKGPDGAFAVIGPGTGAFYQASGDPQFVTPTDALEQQDLKIEIELLIPFVGTFSPPETLTEYRRADGTLGNYLLAANNAPLRQPVPAAESNWGVVTFGRLFQNGTGSPQFTGQVAFVREPEATDFPRVRAGFSHAGERLYVRSVQARGAGTSTRRIFRTDQGRIDESRDLSITSLWNVRDGLQGLGGFVPTISLITLTHNLDYAISTTPPNLPDDSTALTSNQSYQFNQAVIPGRLAARNGIMPGGRHLIVQIAALAVIPSARYAVFEEG